MRSVWFDNFCKILACFFLLLFSFSLQASQLDENEVGRIIINNFKKSKIFINYSHITRPQEDKIIFHKFSYRRQSERIPTEIGELVLDGISYDEKKEIYIIKLLYFLNDKKYKNIKIELYKGYMVIDELIISNVYFSEINNDHDEISMLYEFENLKIKEFSVFSHNGNPALKITNINKSYSYVNNDVNFSIENLKIYLSNILKDLDDFQYNDDFLIILKNKKLDVFPISLHYSSNSYANLLSKKTFSSIEIDSQNNDKLIFFLETEGINEYFNQNSNEDPLSFLISEEMLLTRTINSNNPPLFLKGIEISYKNNYLFQNIMGLFLDIKSLKEDDFFSFINLALNDIFLEMNEQEFGKKHISCISKFIEDRDEILLHYEFTEDSKIGSLYQFLDVILNHDDPIVYYDVDSFLKYHLKNFQCKT